MAWHDTEEAMQAFVDRYGLDFPHVVDEDESLFTMFDFFYQPAWVFIDDDGSTEPHFGALDEATLAERIEGLISA